MEFMKKKVKINWLDEDFQCIGKVDSNRIWNALSEPANKV